jgi:hypothetical protein
MYQHLPSQYTEVYYSTTNSPSSNSAAGYTPPPRLQSHHHQQQYLSQQHQRQQQFYGYSAGYHTAEEEEEEERRRMAEYKFQLAKLQNQRESRRQVDLWVSKQTASNPVHNNLLPPPNSLPESEPLIFYSTPFPSSSSSPSNSVSCSPISPSSFSSIPNAIISSHSPVYSLPSSSSLSPLPPSSTYVGQRHTRRSSSCSSSSSNDSNPRTRHSSLSSIPEEP